MKRGARMLCLLLSVLILVGCAPAGANNDSATAPESSGAVLVTEATVPTEPQEAVKTEQALKEIQLLG